MHASSRFASMKISHSELTTTDSKKCSGITTTLAFFCTRFGTTARPIQKGSLHEDSLFEYRIESMFRNEHDKDDGDDDLNDHVK